jgi:hypothetical protein
MSPFTFQKFLSSEWSKSNELDKLVGKTISEENTSFYHKFFRAIFNYVVNDNQISAREDYPTNT